MLKNRRRTPLHAGQRGAARGWLLLLAIGGLVLWWFWVWNGTPPTGVPAEPRAVLARGSLDVVIESDVNILDIAALTVIVEEAGGRFTDLTGVAVGLATTTVLATNSRLHQPVLDQLRFGS